MVNEIKLHPEDIKEVLNNYGELETVVWRFAKQIIVVDSLLKNNGYLIVENKIFGSLLRNNFLWVVLFPIISCCVYYR